MKIKEIIESERPRERLLTKGPEVLTDSELIAVLLRCGNADESAVELAQRILSESGGLVLLYESGRSALESIKGIGPSKLASLLAAFELGRRFLSAESGIVRKPLLTPRMVYDLMIPSLKGRRNEECWVLFLNVSNYLTNKARISSGGWNSTTIDIKEIARLALDSSASGVILVHNHPGGNPHPSRADIMYTSRLRDALKTLEITLQDHIVISDGAFFAFSEERAFTVCG